MEFEETEDEENSIYRRLRVKNRSSELPCLSASNCIRHRAKKDFRHQEMDGLVLWSMQHAFTTLNNLWEQKA